LSQAEFSIEASTANVIFTISSVSALPQKHGRRFYIAALALCGEVLMRFSWIDLGLINWIT